MTIVYVFGPFIIIDVVTAASVVYKNMDINRQTQMQQQRRRHNATTQRAISGLVVHSNHDLKVVRHRSVLLQDF